MKMQKSKLLADTDSESTVDVDQPKTIGGCKPSHTVSRSRYQLDL